MGMILDTNFIITGEREAKRKILGRADAFLNAHLEESFYITFTVAGELACGQSSAAKIQWQRLCQPYAILPWSTEVSWQYGELYRYLAAKGTLIGTNDLWIAATALVHRMELVTENQSEFLRVPGLKVLGY